MADTIQGINGAEPAVAEALNALVDAVVEDVPDAPGNQAAASQPAPGQVEQEAGPGDELAVGGAVALNAIGAKAAGEAVVHAPDQAVASGSGVVPERGNIRARRRDDSEDPETSIIVKRRKRVINQVHAPIKFDYACKELRRVKRDGRYMVLVAWEGRYAIRTTEVLDQRDPNLQRLIRPLDGPITVLPKRSQTGVCNFKVEGYAVINDTMMAVGRFTSLSLMEAWETDHVKELPVLEDDGWNVGGFDSE
ncbi:uncharacterized protein LOC129600253 [Paramacrobiotus metropolitanus]|uniref:uncharacterized protein LOC129600253 n=1 Tax=Paramacrobiotus metropolitanus TaxID=2943436 RepID=UPI002446001D|nr:uncharacterized protein LOC129600253 [Paramacrobiotus metropolitanus]